MSFNKYRLEKGLWTTSDGKTIEVSKMHPKHLERALNQLESGKKFTYDPELNRNWKKLIINEIKRR